MLSLGLSTFTVHKRAKTEKSENIWDGKREQEAESIFINDILIDELNTEYRGIQSFN